VPILGKITLQTKIKPINVQQYCSTSTFLRSTIFQYRRQREHKCNDYTKYL